MFLFSRYYSILQDIAAQTNKSARFYNRYLLVYTMPTVTPNNRKPIGLCMFLYYVSYLPIADTWFYCKDNFISLWNVHVVYRFFFFVSVLQKSIPLRSLDIFGLGVSQCEWGTTLQTQIQIVCIASPKHKPCCIAWSKHSYVTRTSFWYFSSTFPTKKVSLRSPWNPLW